MGKRQRTLDIGDMLTDGIIKPRLVLNAIDGVDVASPLVCLLVCRYLSMPVSWTMMTDIDVLVSVTTELACWKTPPL